MLLVAGVVIAAAVPVFVAVVCESERNASEPSDAEHPTPDPGECGLIHR